MTRKDKYTYIMKHTMGFLSLICGLSVFSGPAWGPCAEVQEPQVLFERTAQINPKLKEQYRAKVVRSVIKMSKRHNVAPKKLFAILAQECRFRLNCVNHASKDYGIGQINEKTIAAFGFDQQRLLTDLEYSVEAAAIVLADFKKRHGKREPNFWSRYNSGKPSKRQAYEVLVARFM